MAQKLINVGVTANDGTGDAIRQSGIYINENFTEIYALPPVMSDIRFDGNNIKTQSSNADIDVKPSGSGTVHLGAGIKIDDNNIVAIRSNDNISIIPSGTGNLNIAGLAISGNNITATRSNDDIKLSPAGTGGIAIGGLLFSDNNITGTRSNEDINLIPAGTGDVVLSSLRVNGTTLDSTDSSKITIAEAVDVTGALVAKTSISIAGDGATITGILDEDAMGSDSATKLATQQSIKAYVDSKVTAMDLDFQGDSGGALSIDLNSESLTFAGAGGITTAGSSNTMTVNLNTMTGLSTLGMGSLTLAGNDITSSSNADINLTPGGTGTVNMTSLTIDSSIKLFDNKIQCIQSNADMILSASGSGSVAVANIDMNQGTADAVIGATTPAAGTFTTLVYDPANTGTLSTTGLTITDNTITATQSNDNLELRANGSGYVSINAFQFPTADGGTGQLLTTNASKVLTWGTIPILLGSSNIQDGTATISFALETVLDHVTSVGSHELISSTTSTLNEWATAKYDSAWYLSVLRDDISDEFEVVKYSVLHGTTADGSTKDAFITISGQAKTGTNNHMIVDADISGGNVRLRGTGSSPQNSMSFWRIGLGDDDSTGYVSAETDEVSIEKTFDATIGSSTVDLDTWGGAANTAAKYFISVKNTDTGEVGSMEALLTHDGSNSYVSVYNEHYSGNNSLLTVTADYDSGNVRLRGSANAGSNTRVNMFRILLADTEGADIETHTRTVANVTVSSAATAIDTFVDESGSESGYTAAHYIVSGQNGANERFVTEAAVVTDGTNVFITQYGNVSTKGTQMLELSVTHDGSSTVSLKALSTSGGSTTVNCWRVNLSRGEGTATPIVTLNSFPHATYRSAAYNMQIVDSASGNYELFELRVTHDGTNAYVSKFGRVSNTATDLATVTADISGTDVRIRGSISTTNDHIVKYVRRIIEV